MKNLKIFLKILASVIAVIVLIIILLFVVFIIILYILKPKPIQDIEQYNECLYLLQNKDRIKHFPKKINIESENARLYCFPGDYSGYEFVLLLIKTDKNYIEKELKTYSFLNSDTKIGTEQKIYHMPSETVGIPKEDLTYYVLDDKYNYNEGEMYFPYYAGIGISKDMNYILYYYINPE